MVKARGAALAEAEVVVLCDSDCRYERTWLRHLLTPFAERPELQVVAGETTMAAKGPYGLAMALTHVFPRYSGETALQPALFYFANNVRVPERRCWRGSRCRRPAGVPRADDRAQHDHRREGVCRSGGSRSPAPCIGRRSPWDLVARLYTAGRRLRIAGPARSATARARAMSAAWRRRRTAGAGRATARARARSVFAEDRRRYLYLPIAVPILAVAATAYAADGPRRRSTRRPLARRPVAQAAAR